MSAAFAVSELRFGLLRAINYTPEVEAIRRKATRTTSVPLGQLLSSLGAAYANVFTRQDCHPSFGVELMAQADMFATEPSGRVIRRDSMNHPERHAVEKWQILIAGAGTLGEKELYGRCVIADGRLAGKYVGPDAMVLTFSDPGGDLNLFTYAFLATEAGIRAIRSASYGTKLLRLRKDLLSELPIPRPSEGLIKRVAKLVRSTVESRELYVEHLSAARKLVDSIPSMQEALSSCAERRARAIGWSSPLRSMCAWNVASVGSALEVLRQASKTSLRDLVGTDGLYSGNRFARIPCAPQHGIALHSQRDVFHMRRFPKMIVRPRLPDRLLYPPENCLLVACDGQLSEGTLFGRVELAANGLASSAITEHILRVVPRESSLWLFAYLTTKVGHRLLQSAAVGTSIPKLRPDLVADLPVPEISGPMRRQIDQHVADGITARGRADVDEAEAIRIVEDEVLPQWLE